MSTKVGQTRTLAAERLAFAALAVVWLGGLALLLTHRLVVSNDSVSNYAHVWHVARSLERGDGLPYHFPAVAHGEGLAFPYAFLPWASAAVLQPVLGDWVVTCWLVLGFAGVLVAARYAFPELSRPLPAALFLANPFLVESVILFQLPFIWAAAFLFAAAGAWRRGHWRLAIVFGALCEATHPAVAAPLLGLVVLGSLPFERRRWRRLLGAYVLASVLAAPAAVVTLLSPAVADAGPWVATANLLGTLALRGLVIAAPFAIVLAARRLSRRQLWAVLALALVLNVVLIPVRGSAFAWGSLLRTPDTSATRFLSSPAFAPGATYRVLRAGDGKVTMYQVLQAGGRLDSEFFPESFARHSFRSEADYRALLDERGVDFVMLFSSYTERFNTNEEALLHGLVAEGCALLVPATADFSVFDVRMCRGPR